MNFWARNEGQIIGTIGAGIVAILAAFLASWLTQRQINKKDKNEYQGLLYTLHVELNWQNNQFELLKKTLERIESISIENQSFVLTNAPMQFDLSVTEQCLSKIIDYKQFNHGLVALLTSYQNQIRDINFYLDFKNANEVLINQQDTQDIDSRIEDYFNVLKSEYINRTQSAISDIRKLIESELEDYHKNKLILKEKNTPQ